MVRRRIVTSDTKESNDKDESQENNEEKKVYHNVTPPINMQKPCYDVFADRNEDNTNSNQM